MPIQAIDSDRLYRRIARQLSELISNGEFRPGERLPPERELAKQLAVSRPSVREALIALEVEGWVEIRVGSGVFVKPLRPLPLPSPEEGECPFELLRARAIVEGETAALAAKEAIEARQPQKARQAMHQHLARVDREFSRGLVHLKRPPQHAKSGHKVPLRS